MTRWQALMNRLTNTLQISFELITIQGLNLPQTNSDQSVSRSVRDGGVVRFFLEQEDTYVTVLQTNADALSDNEEQLVCLLIEQYEETTYPGQSKEQRLGSYIYEHIINPQRGIEVLPIAATAEMGISEKGIPLLLWNRHEMNLNTEVLVPILESFLGHRIVFLPFPNQAGVVILPPEALGEEESPELELEALCYAIQEVLLSEGGFEVDLSASGNIHLAEEMIVNVGELLDTIKVGRRFAPNHFVHMQSDLQVERLLNHVDSKIARRFIDTLRQKIAKVEDEEIMVTIESFIYANQNISETAKKLFIHRNTLNYRLDRFKQMTGYDVRDFQDALVIQLFLLLDKVTKTTS